MFLQIAPFAHLRALPQFVPTEYQSVPWIQQWPHSLWPRLQAPVGRETVNKPQLAASLGVTQQPECLIFFFFLWRSWGEGSWATVKSVTGFEWRAVWMLTSKRLCKWCCCPMGLMAAPSEDPICSTSIWTLLSSRMPLVLARFWRCCRNATRPESRRKITHTTLSRNPDNNLHMSDTLFWQEERELVH